MAHKCEKIKEFKENSVTISTEYELKTYARVVRIGPVPAIQLPLFVMMVQANAPVGVQVNIKEHEASDEVERFFLKFFGKGIFWGNIVVKKMGVGTYLRNFTSFPE